MGQAGSASRIEAHIQGAHGSQIAVGTHIYQIGSVHGGVVQIIEPEQRPRPRPRPTPVSILPASPPDLLDREQEISTAIAAFQATAPLAFHGEAGIGKTVLLEHLAYHPEAARFPDGVVHLYVGGRPWDDLLQALFEAFYEVEPGTPFKPTEMQVRQALRDKRALILLDDVGLDRGQVEALVGVAPRSLFVLASEPRLLWGRGKAILLKGLPLEDALALVERELGRPLEGPERAAAQSICTTLDGHPLHILRAVARVEEEGKSLEEIARSVQAADPVETLTAAVLSSLSEDQRRLLAVMALLDGAPLPTDHLAALSGVRNVQPALEALMHRGLVQAHSPRYSLSGGLGRYIRGKWDLTPWTERAVDHFTSWVEKGRPSPTDVADVAEAVLRTMEWAAADERWSDVLRLGRAMEEPLTLACRWGAWEQVLLRMLEAARELGDRATEAWALHQLGSRALCLGDHRTARDALTKALRLRQSLGDEAGAAAT
ncbi:MAG TPA: tetratricopeptide repeat protein, partial [Chloroflexi bacterium]|nr:tetratricopeptide repeat protein [Chloroflexota bacterium]